jgi:hypothetical protein
MAVTSESLVTRLTPATAGVLAVIVGALRGVRERVPFRASGGRGRLQAVATRLQAVAARASSRLPKI